MFHCEIIIFSLFSELFDKFSKIYRQDPYPPYLFIYIVYNAGIPRSISIGSLKIIV